MGPLFGCACVQKFNSWVHRGSSYRSISYLETTVPQSLFQLKSLSPRLTPNINKIPGYALIHRYWNDSSQLSSVVHVPPSAPLKRLRLLCLVLLKQVGEGLLSARPFPLAFVTAKKDGNKCSSLSFPFRAAREGSFYCTEMPLTKQNSTAECHGSLAEKALSFYLYIADAGVCSLL